MSADEPRGVTVVELLVVLLITAWLATALMQSYAGLRGAARGVASVGAEAAAVRAVRTVLRAELTSGLEGIDWRLHPPDSVRLRAFRGVWIVCAQHADSSVSAVRLVGRAPDPSKDSALVLRGDGGWEAVRFTTGAGVGVCSSRIPDGATLGDPVLWALSPAPTDPTLIRLFETGSYHLGDGALRYRRGSGGRQPLTEPLPGSARFTTRTDRVVVEVDAAGGRPAILPITSGR